MRAPRENRWLLPIETSQERAFLGLPCRRKQPEGKWHAKLLTRLWCLRENDQRENVRQAIRFRGRPSCKSSAFTQATVVQIPLGLQMKFKGFGLIPSPFLFTCSCRNALTGIYKDTPRPFSDRKEAEEFFNSLGKYNYSSACTGVM
ncbi:hypothetical protein V6C53_03315 [Desulfocurvibacter africanus]|uniref:hypothetical protein n=1 Tax=Desulfocurvibacter africanus TaxID=873 RepID=UPI002FDAA287